jgi:hypothetical protein
MLLLLLVLQLLIDRDSLRLFVCLFVCLCCLVLLEFGRCIAFAFAGEELEPRLSGREIVDKQYSYSGLVCFA